MIKIGDIRAMRRLAFPLEVNLLRRAFIVVFYNKLAIR